MKVGVHWKGRGADGVGLKEWGGGEGMERAEGGGEIGEGMGGAGRDPGAVHRHGGKQSNYRQAIGMTRRDHKPDCGILKAHTASQAGMKTMPNDLCRG